MWKKIVTSRTLLYIGQFLLANIISCDRLLDCNLEDNVYGWLQWKIWCQTEWDLPSRLYTHACTHTMLLNLSSHNRYYYFFPSGPAFWMLGWWSGYYFTLWWISRVFPTNYQSEVSQWCRVISWCVCGQLHFNPWMRFHCCHRISGPSIFC